MKLENQVVSLKLAKKLKELGFKQESHFYWVHINGAERDEWVILSKKEFSSKYNHYPAYTVAELGEMLPEKYMSGKLDNRNFNCWEFDEMFMVKNYNNYQTKTEANARAKMLIYLKENNLLT